MTRWPPRYLPLRPAVARTLQGGLLLGLMVAVTRGRPAPESGLVFTLAYLLGVGAAAGAFFAGLRGWISRGRFRVDEDGLWVGWPRRRGPIPWTRLDGIEATACALVWRDQEGASHSLDWRLTTPHLRAPFHRAIREHCEARETRRTLSLPTSRDGFETQRLRVRPWRAEDWPAFRHAYLAPEMRRGYGGSIWRGRVSRRNFAEIQAAHGHPWGWYWALEEKSTGVVIGLADAALLTCSPPRLRLGYGVFAVNRRKGYATEAVSAIVEVFGAEGGVDAIEATFDGANVGSQIVLSRCGFRGEDPSEPSQMGQRTYRWARGSGAAGGASKGGGD